MRRLYVRLDLPDYDALLRLTHDERRHPSDQAAILLRQTLSSGREAAGRDLGTEHRRLVLAGGE